MGEAQGHEARGLLSDEGGGLSKRGDAQAAGRGDVVEPDVADLPFGKPGVRTHEGDGHVIVDEGDAVGAFAHDASDEVGIPGVASEEEGAVGWQTVLFERIA